MPKVSVITPIYNVAEYLPLCLQSLLSQTLDDIEFICVNDGSTDESLNILRDYAQRDSRIKIIDKPNGGYGHTMNTGLDAAQGEYIGILESDDFIEPCAFEHLYELAKANGDCDIVKANYYLYTDEGDEEPGIVENFTPDVCGRVMSPMEERGRFVLNSTPAIWSAIYRREFLLENGIRFLETPGAAFQDTGFVYKSWIACNSFYLTHEAYLYYRIDNANSSVKSAAKVLYVCDEFNSIEQFLAERPERQSAFASRIAAKKFDTYWWNYGRIDVSFREDFLARTASEFQQARDRGELDASLYDPQAWARLNSIIDDPHAAFTEFEKADDAPEKHPLEHIVGIPVRLRDAAEKATATIREAAPLGKGRYPGASSKLVSIVVPVYNAQSYLDKLFSTLLAQTHENLEIICVNDGSTDDSLSMLESFAAADQRVKVIDVENGGAGAARNIGIDAATGDYLCFVDSDDYIEKDTVAKIVDAACKHKVDVVIYGIDEYDDETHAHKKMKHAVVKGKVPRGKVFRPRDVENFFVNMTGFTVNKLYEMSYFRKLDLRFPSIGAHEDMPFTYAAVVAAERAYYLNKTLYHYRRDREGSRSDTTEKQFIYMLEALECTRDELKRLGIWEECERNFVNYALSVCRWKFENIFGIPRHEYHNTLTRDGWLARLGITSHPSSYYYEEKDRNFYRIITTKSYIRILEDDNEWLGNELGEVVNSKTFKLGSVFAKPVQVIRDIASHNDRN